MHTIRIQGRVHRHAPGTTTSTCTGPSYLGFVLREAHHHLTRITSHTFDCAPVVQYAAMHISSNTSRPLFARLSAMSTPAASKQVILVTGANRGIGYEAVKLLSVQQPDATILLGTLSLDNGQKAIQRMRDEHSGVLAAISDTLTGQAASHRFDNVQPLALDMGDPSSIARAVLQVKGEYGYVNTLINNGGISNAPMAKCDHGSLTNAEVLTINVNGTQSVTEAFLPLMPPHDSQILMVSSEVGSWVTASLSPQLQSVLLSPTLDWPTLAALTQDWSDALDGRPSQHELPPASVTFNAYGPSKARTSAYTRLLAREQEGQRLVLAVTPGLCATPLTGGNGKSPAAGGASVVWPVGRWVEVQPGLLYQDGKALSWCHTRAPPK